MIAKQRKLIALLPMKAHSERVKSKNFRNFAGKPLYRWILDTLLSLQVIDVVVINTDAREILYESGLVESDRLMIRDRKPELRGDFVSMNLILADDVENVKADSYLMTHTTNPLLTGRAIGEAVAKFEEGRKSGSADSLFSVTKRQTRFYRADGGAVNHDPNNLIRTQDLEPWFEENSNLYLFTAESFRTMNARIGAKPLLFAVSKLEGADIDDQEDWQIAEAIALRQQAQSGSTRS
jgi:CMP-N-acetylneuraminic acid synthetase